MSSAAFMETIYSSLEKDEVVLPSYESVMSYNNASVVEKFRDKWSVSPDEAAELFDETKKFLYVAHVAHSKGFDFDIHESTVLIDEMWHAFILCTTDYWNFCQKHFGRLLHHRPISKTDLDGELVAANREGRDFYQERETRFRVQLELILEYLGADSVKRWYVDYAIKFTPEITNKLQRPAFHENQAYGHTASMIDTSTTDAMIEGIVQRTRATLFCGTRCGVYCRCNSNKMRI